jgi:hypothetical protein
MAVPPGPTTALRWQVVIFREKIGEKDLWGNPEDLLEKFMKCNTMYKCWAKHEGKTTGRKHYHCYLRFKTGRNRQQMVKKFGENVRHMNGDDYDNAMYISEKGENKTFQEIGLKKRHDEQSTAVAVDELLKRGQSLRKICMEHIEYRRYINQNKWVLQEVESGYADQRARDSYVPPGELYDWQQHAISILDGDIHPRHIQQVF